MRREYRERFSRQLSIPARHVRHTRAVMHIGIANPLLPGNVSSISGAFETRNFTYLARGPWDMLAWFVQQQFSSL